MILIATTNKYSKAKIKVPTIDLYREWFLNHKGVTIPGWKLEAKLGVTSVRVYVNKLRCEGMPIISSQEGYKYTENKKEIRECYEKLRLRALRAITAAQAMKRIL